MSVIVPFLGDSAEATGLLDAVRQLALAPGDEVIVADNTAEGLVPDAGNEGVRVVDAAAERSAFHARNAGAVVASNDWLLFVDADCRLPPDLLEAYFEVAANARCGILAGAVGPLEDQPGMIPRYARSRRQLSETHHLVARPEWPYPAGITGNLMLRREAFEQVGGFNEGLCAGADIELCWRVQEAGWTLRHVPGAFVQHAHVESLRRLWRQASGHAAGMRWMNRRYPGSFPRPPIGRQLGRCAGAALVLALSARGTRSLFKLIDAVWFLAYAHGYLLGDNRAMQRGDREPAAGDGLLLIGTFPEKPRLDRERRARTLVDADPKLRIEALARPKMLDRSILGKVQVAYAEDDPPMERLRATLWLLVRHPLRCARSGGRRAPTGDAGRLRVLAAPARRCRQVGLEPIRAAGAPDDPAVARLRALVLGQSASTRWRAEPRADA